MDEKEVYKQINDMLEESDYPLEIRDISDIEDFLNDDDNRRLEQYEVIGRLYDELMGDPELDRTPEAY